MAKTIGKTIIQLGIWLVLLLTFFSISNYWQPVEYAIYSALFDTIALFIVYHLAVSFLYPRYYQNQKIFIYISLFALLFLSASYSLIDIYVIPRSRPADKHAPLFIFIYVRYLMVNGFAFFIGTSQRLMQHTNELLAKEKMLTEEKLNTELQLLKAQINPHFIFNALNNIYSMTYMQAKNAPDAVLKLSEMLRYVFYDCSKEQVKLGSELQYIENYISFQQMKSEIQQNIKLTSELENPHFEIAPMLIIPFIENAFKYSRIEEAEGAYVNIYIASDQDTVRFSIENSVEAFNKPLPGSGTGLKNVKHRLDIIYPDQHNLIIREEESKFSVELSIKMKERV